MSEPHETRPVKYFLGLIYSPMVSLWDLERDLQRQFDFVDQKSPALDFTAFTDYYVDEMGPLLFRTWWTLHQLQPPEHLVELKLAANKLEDRYRELAGTTGRVVNIDPGYLNESRLVLASCKDFAHRICLGQGVYAEVTMVYQGDSYRPLEWTYRDYQSPEAMRFFGQTRQDYQQQLRGER